MAEQVFYKVDGKIVSKPGNRRDANRRYHGIENDPITGDQRVVEFTPEEESARDAEEAKWEAERPQREAEERERAAKAEAYRASLVYEPRLIAFLDILGWRAAVEQSVTDPELVRSLGLGLTSLRDQCGLLEWMRANTGRNELDGDPQLTLFSDSIVISVRPDYAGLSHMLSALGFITVGLLWKGLLVRGSVVRGLMYHKGAVAFGPALIAAYDRERCDKFPRIVLDENLAPELGRGTRYLKQDGSLLGYAKTWRRANDSSTFFDFLQPLGAKTFDEPDPRFIAPWLGSIRTPIERGLRQHAAAAAGIYEKYCWLASYFNEICSEYGAAEVLPIRI